MCYNNIVPILPLHRLLRFAVQRTNRSAALFANTSILCGLRAVAAGSCRFMHINKRWPSGENKENVLSCDPVKRVQLLGDVAFWSSGPARCLFRNHCGAFQAPGCICICMYIYIYVHIYIHIERQRDR